jgi:hypothetical protein
MSPIRLSISVVGLLTISLVLGSCAKTKYEVMPGDPGARPAIKKLAIVGFSVEGRSLFRGQRGAVADKQIVVFLDELEKSGKFASIMTPTDVATHAAYNALEKGAKSMTSVEPMDKKKKVHPADTRDWGALAKALDVDGVLVFSNSIGKTSRGAFGAVSGRFQNIDLRVFNVEGKAVYEMKGQQLESTMSIMSWIFGSVSSAAVISMGEEAGTHIAQKMLTEW